MGNWNIHASVCYDTGSVRKNNEDAYYFNGQFAPLSKMDKGAFLTTDVNAAGTLWAICDGMGGQSNGEKASYTAISGMQELQDHLHGRDFETVIQNWVHQANRAVNEQAEGGGSTLVMLYCTDQYIQSAHIGDSRIYRYHNRELIKITKDHSKVEMLLDTNMITPEEARTHPQKNVITRYLGMDSEYICEASIGKKIPLCNGDRFLLCSDGITDMLTDETIAAFLSENNDVTTCLKKIRDSVFQAGAKDNFTVILLELTSADQMDTIINDEDLLPDDEPTIDEENTASSQFKVKIDVTKVSHCEVVLHGMSSRVSLKIHP